MEDLGQVAYDAYGDSVQWRTFRGDRMPPWQVQTPRLKTAWGAAARAVSQEVKDGTTAHKLVVLTGRHRPHELLLLVLSTVSGLSYLIAAPPPTSLAASLPRQFTYVWAGMLAVSGIAGLLGCGWRSDPERGLLIEQGAMVLGSSALLLYGAAIVNIAGARGAFGAGIAFVWVLANLARATQIYQDLKTVRA